MKQLILPVLVLFFLVSATVAGADDLSVPSCEGFSAYGNDGSWISDKVTRRFFGKTVNDLSGQDLLQLMDASRICVKKMPEVYSLKNAHDILKAFREMRTQENAT